MIVLGRDGVLGMVSFARVLLCPGVMGGPTIRPRPNRPQALTSIENIEFHWPAIRPQ